MAKKLMKKHPVQRTVQQTMGAIGLAGIVSLLSAETATALTFNAASEGGSVFSNYSASIRTNGADNYTNLASFVGLDVATLDALTGAEIFGGSAVSQTFFANSGNILSFSWAFSGAPAPDFNDTAFIALNAPNGLRELADTLSPVQSGFFSYTFPNSGNYNLRFGVIDVGDNSGVSQLQVFNLRVGSTAIPTPALLPGLVGLGWGILSKKRSEEQQEG
jgi:hypothetical protein